jgi:hypothetical protein
MKAKLLSKFSSLHDLLIWSEAFAGPGIKDATWGRYVCDLMNSRHFFGSMYFDAADSALSQLVHHWLCPEDSGKRHHPTTTQYTWYELQKKMESKGIAIFSMLPEMSMGSEPGTLRLSVGNMYTIAPSKFHSGSELWNLLIKNANTIAAIIQIGIYPAIYVPCAYILIMQWLGIAREHLKSVTDRELVMEIEDNFESKDDKHIIRLNFETYKPKITKQETKIENAVTLHLTTHKHNIAGPGAQKPTAFLGTTKKAGGAHAHRMAVTDGDKPGHWPWEKNGVHSRYEKPYAYIRDARQPHVGTVSGEHKELCCFNCGGMGHLVM